MSGNTKRQKITLISMQIPNGFGCALGLMQLILYFIYRNHHKKQPEKSSSPLMEMHKRDGAGGRVSDVTDNSHYMP
ncbi:hypothetical protein LINGRAHAP2_LOCUS36564 [Linum grandiflorum]